MPDFTIRDSRGKRVPLPDLPGTGGNIRDPSLPRVGATRRVTEADQKAGRGTPFGTPDVIGRARNATMQAGRMRRQAGTGAGSSSLQMATSRPRDPMWYWKQNNIPFDFTEPEELARIREFCTTPDTLITLPDNTTKPIGTVAVGEEVMGVEVPPAPQRRPGTGLAARLRWSAVGLEEGVRGDPHHGLRREGDVHPGPQVAQPQLHQRRAERARHVLHPASGRRVPAGRRRDRTDGRGQRPGNEFNLRGYAYLRRPTPRSTR